MRGDCSAVSGAACSDDDDIRLGVLTGGSQDHRRLGNRRSGYELENVAAFHVVSSAVPVTASPALAASAGALGLGGRCAASHRHLEVRVTVQAVGLRFLVRKVTGAAGNIAEMGCMRIEMRRSFVVRCDLFHPAVTGRALRIDRRRIGVGNEIVAMTCGARHAFLQVIICKMRGMHRVMHGALDRVYFVGRGLRARAGSARDCGGRRRKPCHSATMHGSLVRPGSPA